MMIGENNIINFPISAQLIKVTDHKFKYYGGDFKVVLTYSKNVRKNNFRIII